MNEITDPQLLFRLKQQVQQGVMLVRDPNIVYQLHKAWRLLGSDDWYNVEIVDNFMRVYRGMIDAKRGIIYLEINSILGLVQERIDSALNAYNAGHDPRYRGM